MSTGNVPNGPAQGGSYNPMSTFQQLTSNVPMKQWERQLWFILVYVPLLITAYMGADRFLPPAKPKLDQIMPETEAITALQQENKTLELLNEGLSNSLQGSTAALKRATDEIATLRKQLNQQSFPPGSSGSSKGATTVPETLKGSKTGMAQQPHIENFVRDCYYEVDVNWQSGLLETISGYFHEIVRDGTRMRAVIGQRKYARGGRIVGCPQPCELVAIRAVPAKRGKDA